MRGDLGFAGDGISFASGVRLAVSDGAVDFGGLDLGDLETLDRGGEIRNGSCRLSVDAV